MKYKVGDKVRVKKDINIKDYEIIEPMLQYKGNIVTISHIYSNSYGILGNPYSWSEHMLEPVIENKQFTKKDFKFGDIITLRNGIQGLITIEEVQYNDDTFNIINDFNDDLTHITNDKNLDIIKVQRYIHYSQYGDTIYTLTTLYERKEEILTKEEKEYLSGVIRPFRDRIKAICKLGDTCAGEFICIDLSNENIKLPFFKQRTMYKGMELKKEYTLEELGL